MARVVYVAGDVAVYLKTEQVLVEHPVPHLKSTGLQVQLAALDRATTSETC